MKRPPSLIRATVALAVAVFAVSVHADVRKWTRSDGTSFDAELVGSNGVEVTLLAANGRKTTLSLAVLSAKDQKYLRDLEKARVEAEKAAAPPEERALKDLIGLQRRVPIRFRYGSTPEDYFPGPTGPGLREQYATVASFSDDPTRGVTQTVEDAVAWEYSNMITYCPTDYDGSSPYGVYINLSPTNDANGLKAGYEGVFDKLKLICASPSQAGPGQTDVRRIALVLDSLATLRTEYKINDSRVFIGGVASGGALASVIAMHYPEFRGSICAVRAQSPGEDGPFGWIPAEDMQKIIARRQGLVWVTGSKDPGRDAILESANAWQSAGFVTRLWDVEGMRVESVPPTPFREALVWLEQNSKLPPPRTRVAGNTLTPAVKPLVER